MKPSLHTPWSDEITLLHPVAADRNNIQDEQGYAAAEDIARPVFCTFSDGVSQREFYLSQEAGLRASASVELWAADYEGEQMCLFRGRRFKVLRSYLSSFDHVTLILTEVLR